MFQWKIILKMCHQPVPSVINNQTVIPGTWFMGWNVNTEVMDSNAHQDREREIFQDFCSTCISSELCYKINMLTTHFKWPDHTAMKGTGQPPSHTESKKMHLPLVETNSWLDISWPALTKCMKSIGTAACGFFALSLL